MIFKSINYKRLLPVSFSLTLTLPLSLMVFFIIRILHDVIFLGMYSCVGVYECVCVCGRVLDGQRTNGQGDGFMTPICPSNVKQ